MRRAQSTLTHLWESLRRICSVCFPRPLLELLEQWRSSNTHFDSGLGFKEEFREVNELRFLSWFQIFSMVVDGKRGPKRPTISTSFNFSGFIIHHPSLSPRLSSLTNWNFGTNYLEMNYLLLISSSVFEYFSVDISDSYLLSSIITVWNPGLFKYFYFDHQSDLFIQIMPAHRSGEGKLPHIMVASEWREWGLVSNLTFIIYGVSSNTRNLT